MERVQHLDDLLLRRVRLGLLLPEGGAAHLPAIRALCQPELGWDDARWHEEEARYRTLWQACYRVPEEALLAVRPMTERVAEATAPVTHRSRWPLAVALVAAGVAVVAVAAILVTRQIHRQSEA
jgi:hypothetical protein